MPQQATKARDSEKITINLCGASSCRTKSSTYKLALLRAVARIAEYAPAVATPAPGGRDAVEVPLGLVALNWLRMYLP
ncbi:hypothetical protein [Sphingomonas sp. ID0503]|uniref:hypothetical protein n=1 Tax=Sphingomonas sp. ID0503 TaxID=3399691 RepID=UPI003AFAA897